jgi:hypothetical protein
MSRHRPSITRSLMAIGIGALVAGNGCMWPTDLPASAQPMDPPAIYSRWWNMVENCSGHTAPFNSVRWYRTPVASIRIDGSDVVGYYAPSGHYVVVTDGIVDDGARVRHEMLHALLNVGGHPRDEFLGACADLVDCHGPCISDAGKWHAGVPFDTLSVDSMSIAASVRLLPREQDGQRWVVLDVTAQNPTNRAVLAIPLGAIFSWGVDVGGRFSTSLSADDSSMLFFAARQTRHWFYELRVASDSTFHTIQPGNRVIFGAFGQYWTTPQEVIVSP